MALQITILPDIRLRTYQLTGINMYTGFLSGLAQKASNSRQHTHYYQTAWIIDQINWGRCCRVTVLSFGTKNYSQEESIPVRCIPYASLHRPYMLHHSMSAPVGGPEVNKQVSSDDHQLSLARGGSGGPEVIQRTGGGAVQWGPMHYR